MALFSLWTRLRFALVSVPVHGAPEREKDSDTGASRGLPLSGDCNLECIEEREGEETRETELPACSQHESRRGER